MLLLDAINEVLPKLGEHPVTSTDSKSPTLAVIIPQINNTLRNKLTSGYWFNSFELTLYPNSEQEIDVPEGTLMFTPHAGQANAIQRGEQFFNGGTMNFKFPVPSVKGILVQTVPFEQLPESAAQLVLYEALVTIYVTDIGIEAVVQEWQRMRADAEKRLSKEHLLNRKYTTRMSRRYTHLRASMRG